MAGYIWVGKRRIRSIPRLNTRPMVTEGTKTTLKDKADELIGVSPQAKALLKEIVDKL